MKTMQKDSLRVEIYDTRAEMGKAAGTLAAKRIRECLQKKGRANVIFAAAPSQNEMLETLVAAPDIDWNRVNAFHMDEYVGLSKAAPQCFGNFLKEHIFGKLPFGSALSRKSSTAGTSCGVRGWYCQSGHFFMNWLMWLRWPLYRRPAKVARSSKL